MSRPYRRPAPDPASARSRLLAVAATLAVLLAFGRPGYAGSVAAFDDDEGGRWAELLFGAPYAGEGPVLDFRGIIRVPPDGLELFEPAGIADASADRAGSSYQIVLDFPDGQARLRGELGRAAFDLARASAPPGCAGAPTPRSACVRESPYYEYFPDLTVAGGPAIATYGGFETNLGEAATLSWYDPAADTSYTIVLSGADAVIRAGFFGGRVDTHAAAARALATDASRFVAVDTAREIEGFWTVIVASTPGRAAAEQAADRLRARGLPGDVLYSSDYSSLTPGYWVAFSGRFASEGRATSEAAWLRSVGFSGAYAREVRP